MITFLYPLYFLLLIPVIFLLILLYIYGGKKLIIGDISVLKQVFKSNSFFYKIIFLFIFIIFLFFISILANPVIQNTIAKNTKNGIDIQIILDISYSMIAEDLSPNRLEVAKKVISGFLEKEETDRIGIVVFAGKTFTSIPLTFDYKIIEKILSKINVDTINQNYNFLQGTAVGDALLHAGDSFKDQNRKKVIILLTDGEANRGLDPIIATEYLKENIDKNLKVYTIGIGGDEETSLKIKDNFGGIQELKIAPVDEKTLRKIADKTNGKFYRATDEKTLENIFDEISSIEKTEIKTESYNINIPKYTYFLYILIFSFMSLLILKYRKKI